jgi:NADH-ubiquinone oxidoreductase chain 2
MVLYSATHSGYLLLATIAILVSVISAAYYLRVIRLIFFDTPKFYLPLGDRTKVLHSAPYPPSVALYGNHSMVIASITLLIIMFIAKPKPLLNSIHLLALCSNGLVIDD